jgi:hypothetical protein
MQEIAPAGMESHAGMPQGVPSLSLCQYGLFHYGLFHYGLFPYGLFP